MTDQDAPTKTPPASSADPSPVAPVDEPAREPVPERPTLQAARPPAAPRWWWLAALLLFVASVALYSPTFDDAFTQDDHLIIGGSESLRQSENWLRAFSTDFFTRTASGGMDISIGYYRPIPRISWMAAYSLWGYDAGRFHLLSVLWHGLASVLLLLFLRYRGFGLFAALPAALVFAMHPSHAEAVHVITAVSDVQTTVFVLLALLAYEFARRGTGARQVVGFVAAGGFTFLASCAKEAGVMALPLLMLLSWVDGASGPLRGRIRTLVTLAAPSALALVAYFILRSEALGYIADSRKSQLGPFAYVYGPPVVFLHYLKVQFYPLILQLRYPPFTVPETLPPMWYASVAICAGLAASVAVAYRRGHSAVLLAAAFLVLGQLPSMAFHMIRIPGSETALAIANRWTYLPSVGVAVLVAWALVTIAPRARGVATALSWCAAGLLGFMTWVREPIFENDLSMMSAEVTDMLEWPEELRPPDARYNAMTTLGMMLFEQGDTEGARGYLQQALTEAPGNVKAMINLANVELRRGDYDRVIALADEALTRKFFRDRDDLFMLRGLAHLNKREAEKAVADFRNAISFNASVVDAHLSLANALSLAGRKDEATAALVEASRQFPRDLRIQFNLGTIAASDCSVAGPAMRRYLDLGTHDDPRRRTMAEELLKRCGSAQPGALPPGR
jgi:tetratricopeptide (TPR) repeat protein